MEPQTRHDNDGWNAPIVDFHIHCPGPAQQVGNPMKPEHKDLISKLNSEVPDEEREAFHAAIHDPVYLRDHLRSQGVSYGVMLADMAPATTGVMPNEAVGEFCRNVPELIPMACLNPFMHHDMPGILERLVQDYGFKALKLLPPYQHFYPNDARMYPVYAKAQELGLPIMFHTGLSMVTNTRVKYADPLLLDDVAIDFPNLKIVMAHSGRGIWYEQAFLMATLHENIYMEISGLPPQNLPTYFPKLDRMLDKVIFGTDSPQIINVKKNIDLIKQLPFPRHEIEKILGLNALKVLPPLGVDTTVAP